MAPRSCVFFGAAISALVVSLGVPAIVSAQEQVEVTVTVKDGQKTKEFTVKVPVDGRQPAQEESLKRAHRFVREECSSWPGARIVAGEHEVADGVDAEEHAVAIVEDYAWCLELWRCAATEEILLQGMSRGEALSLRSRLYRIRAAMKRQSHSYYPDVARAKISVIQLDTGAGGDELWTLSILPTDVHRMRTS